jgi:hypothetical protein
VVVTDKNGNLVTDLVKEDFQILDDGKKVPIGFFAGLGAAGAAAAQAGSAQPPRDPPRRPTIGPTPGRGMWRSSSTSTTWRPRREPASSAT